MTILHAMLNSHFYSFYPKWWHDMDEKSINFSFDVAEASLLCTLPFFSISGPVPKVTENGTFRAILH